MSSNEDGDLPRPFSSVAALLRARRRVRAGAQFAVRTWLPWRTDRDRTLRLSLSGSSSRRGRATSPRASTRSTPRWRASSASRRRGRPTSSSTIRSTRERIGVALSRSSRSINLWATPPDPREDIGEFPHVGRDARRRTSSGTSRISRDRRATRRRGDVWDALPVNLGPIALRAPRWVIEGYATFIEGRVTGSGRPHGAWRAAFLRQWALEGQLPRYDQLDASGAFAGGSFAYLAGSAFLEWLAAQHGDSSLVAVWRRLQRQAESHLRRGVRRRVRRERRARCTGASPPSSPARRSPIAHALRRRRATRARSSSVCRGPRAIPRSRRTASASRSCFAPPTRRRASSFGTPRRSRTPARARRDSLLLKPTLRTFPPARSIRRPRRRSPRFGARAAPRTNRRAFSRRSRPVVAQHGAGRRDVRR